MAWQPDVDAFMSRTLSQGITTGPIQASKAAQLLQKAAQISEVSTDKVYYGLLSRMEYVYPLDSFKFKNIRASPEVLVAEYKRKDIRFATGTSRTPSVCDFDETEPDEETKEIRPMGAYFYTYAECKHSNRKFRLWQKPIVDSDMRTVRFKSMFSYDGEECDQPSIWIDKNQPRDQCPIFESPLSPARIIGYVDVPVAYLDLVPIFRQDPGTPTLKAYYRSMACKDVSRMVGCLW